MSFKANFKKFGLGVLLLAAAGNTPSAQAGFQDIADSAIKLGFGVCCGGVTYNSFRITRNDFKAGKNWLRIGFDIALATIALYYCAKMTKEGVRELGVAFKAI